MKILHNKGAIQHGNKMLRLALQEYLVLRYLEIHSDRFVPVEELRTETFFDDIKPGNVRVVIMRIRKSIEAIGGDPEMVAIRRAERRRLLTPSNKPSAYRLMENSK